MPSIVLPEDKEKTSFEPLEEGSYNCEILGAEFGQAQKGTEFMELTLREVNDGRRIWTKLYFTENSGWKIKSLLSAAGCEIPPVGTPVDINEEYAAKNLVGKKVTADIEIEEYDGKKRNTVKRFSSAAPF